MKTVAIDFDALVEKAASLPADVPVFMLNLLKFRDQADYGDNPEGFAACSGKEAYFNRYAPVATRFVTELGGEVVWAGEAQAMLVSPPDEDWDTTLLVRYPDKEAFLALAAIPEYQDVVVHRTAALVDSRLVAHLAAEVGV